MCAGVQVLARGASGWVQREIREDAASSEGIPSASMPTLGFARFARHYPKLVPVHPRAREKFRFCLFTYCHHPHRFHRPTRRPSPTERELALANPMSQLDPCKRERRVVERFEPHHGCTASLDRPVVLLNHVVEVLQVRTSTLRQIGCPPRSRHNTRRLGTWPSRVTLRGPRGCEVSALRKNACAAAMPRSGRNRKSAVLPCLSTAR